MDHEEDPAPELALRYKQGGTGSETALAEGQAPPRGAGTLGLGRPPLR